MTTAEFLRHLEGAGVTLQVEGDRIRFRGSRAALNAETLAAIAERKEDLRRLLTPPTTDCAGDDESPRRGDLPPAYELREKLGWSVARFAAFSQGLIGRPGPSTLDEDRLVAQAMAERNGGR